MTAQDGGTGSWDLLYVVEIYNEPCITLPSHLHIMDTLGYLNFVVVLVFHKPIPSMARF